MDALASLGFISQESISQVCEEGAVRRRGTSGFEMLPDGKESYMVRLAMIEAAQRTLDVQYFIWSDDVVGTVMADRLLAAADRGVRVRLLLDSTRGAQREVSSAALAVHPNIEVGFFNPITHLKGIFAGNPIPVIGELDRIQCRMHNKMMVVDNTVVIGGGRNLGDTYFGIDRQRNMRDLDYLATGPVVKDASNAFDAYWRSSLTHVEDQAKVTKKDRKKLQDLRDHVAKKKRALVRRNGTPYPTTLTRAESLKVLREMTGRMTWASYEFVADSPERMLILGRMESPTCKSVEDAIRGAKSEIVIHNAYFIPQKGLLDLLRGAVLRGVKVRVLTNSLASIDGVAAMAGIANRRRDILNTGIGMYELNAKAPSRKHYIHSKKLTPMGMHTKGIVVDGHTSFIGSYNMDPRSKFINTETGVVIQNPAFATRLKKYLEEDLQSTHSWHLERTPAGLFQWTGQKANGKPSVHHLDPGTPLVRFISYWFFRLMPMEDLL